MSAVRAILPAPGASVLLAVFWLLLVTDVSAAQVVLAVLLGLVVPLLTRRFRATRLPVRRAGAALELARHLLHPPGGVHELGLLDLLVHGSAPTVAEPSAGWRARVTSCMATFTTAGSMA